MSNLVQKFILKASPRENHPKYFIWNIATLCILIGDDSNESAYIKAKLLIAEKGWIPISHIHRSTIIEDTSLHQNQVMMEEFHAVRKGKESFLCYPDGWCGFKDSPPLLFPKITEALIDRVFINAGGGRFIYDDSLKVSNPDYLINDHIFELKIIEEERLLKETVQEKIASKFRGYDDGEVEISLSSLDETNYKFYSSIFRSPLQNSVKQAGKQIKSVKEFNKSKNLKGGVIIINNGTSSLTASIFEENIVKSIKNNTSEIDTFLLINSWCETDGFNTNFQFTIKPNEQNEVQKLISTNFIEVINAVMNEWGRNQFKQTGQMMEPLRPISFQKDGKTFYNGK
jgi:hypothetical protein